MVPANLGRLAFIIGLVVSAGAVGCFITDEQTSSSNDQVNEGSDISAVLKSTLILDGGCTAAKVGPRHLLVAARCVADKPDFAEGKAIKFKQASAVNAAADDDEGGELVAEGTSPKKDAAADEDDNQGATEAGTGETTTTGTDAGKRDAGANKPPNRSTREATIAEVDIHPSYTAKCKNNACAFGAIAASDAKDIAVIVLDADLESIPTVPVDLDTVGQSDSVLAIGSGCAKLDGTARALKTYKTTAVPAKSVNHAGSPYVEKPELVTRLNAGYVVTPGQGWRSTEAKLCMSDIGAPLFRGGQAAVAGVTSNFTTWEAGQLVPVTVHHTKVDTTSKVGPWLETLGVETTHSCSEATGGCVKKEYDGGAPTPVDGTVIPDDAGGDGKAKKSDAGDESDDAGEVDTNLPPNGEVAPLPASSEDDEATPPPNSGDDYDAGPKKKKKKAASGCSAAPGEMPSGSSGMVVVLGIAVAAAAARRRSRSRSA